MSDLLDVQVDLCRSRLAELRARQKAEKEARIRKRGSRSTVPYWSRRRAVLALRARGMKYADIGERLGVTGSRARELLRSMIRALYNRRRTPMLHLEGENWQATNCISNYCMVWPSDKALESNRFRHCFKYDPTKLAATSRSVNVNLEKAVN